MVGTIQVTQTLEAESAFRQTYSVAALAAFLGSACYAPLTQEFKYSNFGQSAQIERVYAGIPSSNSNVQVTTALSVDMMLAQEFSKVFIRLAQNQRELDPVAKSALYSNLSRLYRR
jgi:hypothetical protein